MPFVAALVIGVFVHAVARNKAVTDIEESEYGGAVP